MGNIIITEDNLNYWYIKRLEQLRIAQITGNYQLNIKQGVISNANLTISEVKTND